MWKRALWSLVPLLGLTELGAHWYDAHRAPRERDWQDAAPGIRALRTGKELVVVAPYWAEPWARHVLGDDIMPLAEVARPDVSAYARAIEVSILGEEAPELSGWTVQRQERHGKFRYRVLENPNPAHVTFDFVDTLGPEATEVTDLGGRACAWTDHARVENGGLGGHPTFPARRFACGGGSRFVGVTVIDDPDYRPRRCIWAPPAVRIAFRDVPMGKTLYGYAGSPWVLVRNGDGSPAKLEVRVNGRVVGAHVQRDAMGWARFSFPTDQLAGKRATVELSVTSEDPNKPFCFYADTR